MCYVNIFLNTLPQRYYIYNCYYFLLSNNHILITTSSTLQLFLWQSHAFLQRRYRHRNWWVVHNRGIFLSGKDWNSLLWYFYLKWYYKQNTRYRSFKTNHFVHQNIGQHYQRLNLQNYWGRLKEVEAVEVPALELKMDKVTIVLELTSMLLSVVKGKIDSGTG